jgi:accessory gene regulator B
VIVVSSALIGKVVESIILLLTILPLQSFGGGYHAKTHLRCFLIMYIGWWAVIFLLPFVKPFAAIAIPCVATPVIYCLAPVPHVNVPMSEARRVKLKNIVRVITLFLSILSGVLLWVTSEHIGKTMAAGIGVAAVSMLAAHIKNLSLNRQA